MQGQIVNCSFIDVPEKLVPQSCRVHVTAFSSFCPVYFQRPDALSHVFACAFLISYPGTASAGSQRPPTYFMHVLSGGARAGPPRRSSSTFSLPVQCYSSCAFGLSQPRNAIRVSRRATVQCPTNLPCHSLSITP